MTERKNVTDWVTDEEPGYQTLAVGIIMQAIEDFRAAYRRLRCCPSDPFARMRIEEVTRFFCSELFMLYSNLDGPDMLKTIIRKLDEEETISSIESPAKRVSIEKGGAAERASFLVYEEARRYEAWSDVLDGPDMLKTIIRKLDEEEPINSIGSPAVEVSKHEDHDEVL